MDGQGPDRGLCRGAGPAAHLQLGDHQSARIREAPPARRAPAAQHPSPGGHALQALRHRPGGPARRAHPHRALRRRRCGPRPDPGLGRRHLLGRPAAATPNAGRAGHHRSVALFYLSAWKNAASAQAFAALYAGNWAASIRPQARPPPQRHSLASLPPLRSRSTPPPKVRWSSPRAASWFRHRKLRPGLARKLAALILDAQGQAR